MPAPVLSPFVLDVAATTDTLLTAWSAHINPTTHQWNTLDASFLPDYWFAEAHPAGVGALYDRVIAGNKWRDRAIATIEGALTLYTQSNGSFGPLAPPGDNSIDTWEFGTVMAVVYLTYKDSMSLATRARWEAVMLASVEYLHAHGNVNYYTNGNIELGEYVFENLVYLITGDYNVGQVKERTWWAAHDPVAANADAGWAGYGFVLPSGATADTYPYDGHATTGYFTESGAGGTGLDYSYTQWQSSLLCLGYLFDPEPRVARLINLCLNTIWPRVNTSTWAIDMSGGTRVGFGQTGVLRNFDTPALAVADLRLGRTGLADYQSQYLDGASGLKSTYTGVDELAGVNALYNRSALRALGVFLNFAAGL